MKKVIVTILVVVLGIAYYVFNPNDSKLFPKCPFYVLTGYKCPGCGSQRAMHYLLNCDIIKAYKENALLVLSIPLIGILLYGECNRKKKPQLYCWLNSLQLIWVCFSIIIIWWIGRNLFGC